jgi:hypothetical protein
MTGIMSDVRNQTLCLGSSDTVKRWRPLALLAATVRRPFAVAILSRNPCLFFLFLFDGWYVLFISFLCYYADLMLSQFAKCKGTIILLFTKNVRLIFFIRKFTPTDEKKYLTSIRISLHNLYNISGGISRRQSPPGHPSPRQWPGSATGNEAGQKARHRAHQIPFQR